MKRGGGHYQLHPCLLQETQRGKMLVSRVTHVMCFVHDDSKEMLTKDCVRESSLCAWYLPGAGIFTTLLYVCLLEVVEQCLVDNTSSLVWHKMI